MRNSNCEATLLPLILLIQVLGAATPLQVARAEGGPPTAFVLQFGSFGQSNGQFNMPQGVSVDAHGSVFVADTGNHRIQEFDPIGNSLFAFGKFCNLGKKQGCTDPDGNGPLATGDGQFYSPLGIDIDPEGRIVVADSGNHRVQVFSNDGSFLLKFPVNGTPSAVATDMAGNIYVTDTNNHRLKKFARDGLLLSSIGSRCRMSTGENCVDPDGVGPMERGDGQFLSPKGVEVDSSGRIIVSDSSNQRIQVFDASGAFLFKFGGLGGNKPGGFANPLGVSVDADNSIMVADRDGRKVDKFNSNGIFLWRITRTDSGPIDFLNLWAPRDVAVDLEGNIIAADTANNRIRVFSQKRPLAEAGSDVGAYVNETLTFDGKNSLDPDGMITDYQWTFGDGASVHGGRVFHSYANGGQYSAILTVTDSSGLKASDRRQVWVSPLGNALPNANAGPDAELEIGEVATFDGGRSVDPDGRITEFRWNFGDGGQAVGPNPTHRFATSGNFNVTLTVIDDRCGLGQDALTVTSKPVGTPRVLLQFGGGGARDGRFGYPTGIVVGPGRSIFVADSGNSRIQVFDVTGKFLFKFGSQCRLSTGEGCVDPDGPGPLEPGDGQLWFPRALAVDDLGNIYVADTLNSRVQKFDPFGRFAMKFGRPGSGHGEFVRPKGIAVDDSGRIYVVDTFNNRVQVFDSSAKFLFSFGSPGFINPKGIAIDPLGNMVVAASPANMIFKFDANGKLLLKFGGFCKIDAGQGCTDPGGSGPLSVGDGQFYDPKSLDVDSEGNIYVADSFNNRIQKFDSAGRFLGKFGGPCILKTKEGCVDLDGVGPMKAGDGQFFHPYDIAIDPNGGIVVLDTFNNRVIAFQKP